MRVLCLGFKRIKPVSRPEGMPDSVSCKTEGHAKQPAEFPDNEMICLGQFVLC